MRSFMPDGGGLSVHVVVNGEPRTVVVSGGRLLIDLLRSDLGLTGTKEACGIGVCGACSVIVDGRLMSSCIVLAATVDGSEVTTIEGLSHPDGTLTPIQEAFIECGGFQCGICTPGQIVAATALLDQDPQPPEDEIREWMTGNLCRCTGYRGIVDAILQASREGDSVPATAR